MAVFFRTRAHLLVCTGPDCAKRGAYALYDRVTAALERERLAYYKDGGSLRLTQAGCLGACASGPNACAYYARGEDALAEAWYSDVTEDDVVELARALHEGREPPGAKRFDR